jgi:protein O-mannosyl-transferase
VAVYGPAVTFGFTNLDDQAIILDNFGIMGNLANVPVAFATDAFLRPDGTRFYRPMQTLTFMLDAAVGGTRPAVYHATNLLLHVLASCLLLALLKALRFPPRTSLFLSVFFAVHPLFTHAVAWVPSRGDLLIGGGGLTAFLTFLRFRERGRWYDLTVHGVAVLVAVFSKETALLIPIVCVGYAALRQRATPLLRRDGLLLAVWGAAIMAYLVARSHVLTGSASDSDFGLTPLLRNLPVVLLFIGKLIVPWRLSTMPVIDPISVGIGVGVLALLLRAAVASRGVRWSVVAFGAGWYLVLLAPSLLWRHPMADVAYDFFEHRSYLPCVGLLILLAELSSAHPGLFRRPAARPVLVAVLLLFAGLSFAHARDYRNPVSFFDAALADNPRNAMALNNRGTAKFQGGDLNGAMSDLSKAIAIKPDYAQAYYNRAVVYGQTQALDAALSDYDRSIQFDSTQAMVYFNRSTVRWFRRDLDGALADCNHAIRLQPGLWVWYYHRGNVEFDRGRSEIAIGDYDTAIAAIAQGRGDNDPRYSSVINNPTAYADLYVRRGRAYRALGKAVDAIGDYNQALTRNPQDAEAYYGRGLANADLKDTTDAIGDLTTALTIDPNYGPAWRSRGELKLRTKDRAGACHDWEQARRLGQQGADSLWARYCAH